MHWIYIVITLLLSLPLRATVYYVDDVATNGNGTQASPFNSIHDALELCNPGDVVRIYPGVYNLTKAVQSSKDGLLNQPITIEGVYPSNRPILTRPERVALIVHEYHILRNLIMDSQMAHANMVKLREAHGTKIINCEVKNGKLDGIDIRYSNDVLIEGCEIHHCLKGTFNDQKDAHGIVAIGQNNLRIQNTEIYYCSGDAFQTDPLRSAPGWDNTYIKDCHFWTGPLPANAGYWNAGESPGEGAIDTKVANIAGYRPLLHIDGLVTHGYTNNGYIPLRSAIVIKEGVRAILNRIVAYNNQIAFRFVGDTGNGSAHVEMVNSMAYDNEVIFIFMDEIEYLKIYNCTFDAAGQEQYLDGASYDPDGFSTGNCLFINSVPSMFQTSSNAAATDEFFIDRSVKNYHLTCTSPAVNAGINHNYTSTDFDGDPRTSGSYDQGADELNGSEVETVQWDDGANDGLWSSATNWSENTIPQGCSTVKIEGNYSVMVNENAQVRAIEVKAGNEFFVPIGNELKVAGN